MQTPSLEYLSTSLAEVMTKKKNQVWFSSPHLKSGKIDSNIIAKEKSMETHSLRVNILEQVTKK